MCRSWKHWRELRCAAGHFAPGTWRDRRWWSPRRARRIPVNAVDDKDNCTFLFPALVRRGPLSIGISTGGASPTAAVYVKEKIEAALPGGDGWNGILEYLAARRAPVRASVPDETARARLFAALFDACMEKGRPLEQAEFDALAARMEREGPGNA